MPYNSKLQKKGKRVICSLCLHRLPITVPISDYSIGDFYLIQSNFNLSGVFK